MTKARDLANFVSAGSPLADGTLSASDLGLVVGVDVQAYAANLATLSSATITNHGLSILDDVDGSATRTTLGLGTASTLDVGTAANQVVQLDANAKISTANLNVGTAANQVVQLDANAKLPAVDGGQLTNIQGYSIASALAFE